MANKLQWDSVIPRASRPFHVMVKPIGPRCNLNCAYCFYLEKEALFDHGERFRMTEETLEAFTRNYIQSQPGNEITFAWQGGEPTLMGIPFFQKALEFQKLYGQGRKIDNAFQTNGLLIDDDWARFFKANNFLVGVSIDGPAKLHDTYRRHRNGRGSHAEVMRGIEKLKQHGVEWNSLTCVNRANAEKPLEVYRFLRGIGSRYMQFIPIVERLPDATAKSAGLSLHQPPRLEEKEEGEVTRWSVSPEGFGDFLCAIYDRWVRHDVGKYFIQHFDTALGKWLGVPGGICVSAETCGEALALEHDGGVYACDHYVYPAYKRGNSSEQPFQEMVESPGQQAFGLDKRNALPKQCRECPVLFACNGGCPKHRFTLTREAEPGLNYLCRGYYRFFTHIDPTMRQMAALIQQRRSPAEIMKGER